MSEQREFPIPLASDVEVAAFIAKYGKPYDPETDEYQRAPFVADIREGKNDPIYNAHSYHTKVPPRAIIPYILHYTEPGDVILDPFCGSGMTGVAAMMCADPPRDILGAAPGARKGARRVILNDLSPAACHIAYNYCTAVDVGAFRMELERIKEAVKHEFDWLYGTEHYEPAVGLYDPSNAEVLLRLKNPPAEAVVSALHRESGEERLWELLDRGEVESRLGEEALAKEPLPAGVRKFICIPATTQYTIWSDLYRCQGTITIRERTGRINRKTGRESIKTLRRARGCGAEFSLWDAAVNKESGDVEESFACPICGQQWKKIQLKRSGIRPVVTNYSYRGLTLRRKGSGSVVVEAGYRGERPISARERDQIDASAPRIKEFALLGDVPMWTDGPQYRRNALRGRGVRTVADFYTDRNHLALALLHQQILRTQPSLRPLLLFCLTAISLSMTRMYKYRENRKGGILMGSLYLPSLFQEMNVGTAFFAKTAAVTAVAERPSPLGYAAQVLCEPARALLSAFENCVDYIFTDPPFGSNIYYSEASCIWEAWLGKRMDRREEAVVHRKEDGGNKTLNDYSGLMTGAFQRMYHLLKPGRYATVEFNNSDGQVFEAIKVAVREAGFNIENMLFLDKEQKTFKQLKREKGEEDVVGHDVIFNLRKPVPKHALAGGSSSQGSDDRLEHLAADAIRAHLRGLPGRIQSDPRTYSDEHRTTPFLNTMLMNSILKDTNVERINLPFIDSVCSRYFKKIDNRWYLPEEVVGARPAEGLFGTEIKDETTALQWLHRRLSATPMRIGELRPHWMRATVKLTSDLSTRLERYLRENFWLDRATRRWRVPTEEERAELHNLEQQRARHDAERFLADKLNPRPADMEILGWIGHLYEAASFIEQEAIGLSDSGEEPGLPEDAADLYTMMPRLLRAVLKENAEPNAYARADRQCRVARRKLEELARGQEDEQPEPRQRNLFDQPSEEQE